MLSHLEFKTPKLSKNLTCANTKRDIAPTISHGVFVHERVWRGEPEQYTHIILHVGLGCECDSVNHDLTSLKYICLQGETGKMSASDPNSAIYVTDSAKDIKNKVCY